MFSWLGKKRAPPSLAPESHVRAPATGAAPPAAQLIERTIARWDAVIAGVQGEVDVALARASVESETLMAAISDFQPLSRLWAKTEAELRPFVEELSNKWNELSSELSAQAASAQIMQREGLKRDAAHTEITIRQARVRNRVMARAALELKQKGEQRGDAAMLAAFAAAGALHLGQYAGQAAWEVMQRAQTRLNGYRERAEVPLSLLEELESSARVYYSTWLSVEAEHAPLQLPYVASKLERYMKDVERTLRQYWQWRDRAK